MGKKARKDSTHERKIFVLDTSVIIYDHTAIKNFAEHDVVIPITVLEELDNSRLERVFRADDQQPGLPDQPLQQLRAVPQMVHRHADIGSNRLAHERVRIDAARAPGDRRDSAAAGVIHAE